METWYRLVDALLPFAWTEHLFMKNALLAVIILTPVCGLVGTLIVGNRMAFFADSIGHSTLTGLGVAVLLQADMPLAGIMLSAALFAVAVALLRRVTAEATDTVIGSLAAFAVALGVVILSRGGGFARYSRFLIGDLLSIAPAEIRWLGVVLAVIVLAWALLLNRLVLLGMSPSIARSRGVGAFTTELLFLLAISQLVAIAIPWVGLLVVNALLVLPAAAARNVSRNLAGYHLVAVALATLSGFLGLFLSYEWDTAAGATIVLVAFAFYAVTSVTGGVADRRSIR